jgi:hypothetical protein
MIAGFGGSAAPGAVGFDARMWRAVGLERARRARPAGSLGVGALTGRRPLDSSLGEVEGACICIAMNRRRFVACFGSAGLCLLAACGGGDEKPAARAAAPTASATAKAMPDERFAFALEEEHGSGRSGTVTVNGGDGGFNVALAVEPKRDQVAHIHNVTCREYRAMNDFDAQLATVELNLRDVANGKSKTSVSARLADYRTGGFSINVHSYRSGFPVVACGDIPAG